MIKTAIFIGQGIISLIFVSGCIFTSSSSVEQKPSQYLTTSSPNCKKQSNIEFKSLGRKMLEDSFPEITLEFKNTVVMKLYFCQEDIDLQYTQEYLSSPSITSNFSESDSTIWSEYLLYGIKKAPSAILYIGEFATRSKGLEYINMHKTLKNTGHGAYYFDQMGIGRMNYCHDKFVFKIIYPHTGPHEVSYFNFISDLAKKLGDTLSETNFI